MERRLAAILSADVVGYSRLIRADEEGTLAAFKGLLSDVIRPKTTDHGGRIVKLMGDGILAEFASVVDAVHAAREMQRSLGQRNAELPEDRRIELRMGINLGDVVIEGDDIYGDGVNVASRLEALSQPGGLCISAKVYEEVRDRTDLVFEDLGDRELKNIDRPVHVYRLQPGTAAKPQGGVPQQRRSGSRPLGNWTIVLGAAAALVLVIVIANALLPDVAPNGDMTVPTVAVVPFESIGNDSRQDEFVAGLIEDLRITLSGETGLRVISRDVAAQTDGAHEALYVIEGSVRQSSGRMRITASLISAKSGVHLWGGRYDRRASDILTVQEEVARKISTGLALKLSDEESKRLSDSAATSILWDGLAKLGRLGERTILLSMNVFAGKVEEEQAGRAVNGS